MWAKIVPVRAPSGWRGGVGFDLERMDAALPTKVRFHMARTVEDAGPYKISLTLIRIYAIIKPEGGEHMKRIKSLFKHKEPTLAPMPPYDEIVKSLHDKDLSYTGSRKICKVIYSKDNSKRFVVLESNKGFFKYIYEEICVFDEFDWNSHFGYLDGIKPGWWEPQNCPSVSFFGTEDEALSALKCEPKYQQFFE